MNWGQAWMKKKIQIIKNSSMKEILWPKVSGEEAKPDIKES